MFNNCIQHAAWDSTSAPNNRNVPKILYSEVTELIKNKRKLRKRWQQFRDPQLKKALNKAAKDLKSALSEIGNREISKHLEDLRNPPIFHYGKRQGKLTNKQLILPL